MTNNEFFTCAQSEKAMCLFKLFQLICEKYLLAHGVYQLAQSGQVNCLLSLYARVCPQLKRWWSGFVIHFGET